MDARPTQRQKQRGIKRDADDTNLSDFQRFEKRLRALSISRESSGLNTANTTNSRPIPADGPRDGDNNNPNGRRSSPPCDDSMHVDDTPHRVYISNLEAELADSDSDSPSGLIFLPDIERHFSRLPPQVPSAASTTAPPATNNKQLVLYRPPESLAVWGQAGRAKADARRAASGEQEARQHDMSRRYHRLDASEEAETAHGYSTGYASERAPPAPPDDPDAMDLG